MASLLFEGEFQELSNKQSQFLRDVLHKRGYSTNKVVFASVRAPGDNRTSNVKRVTVEVPGGENFQMIAKIASTLEERRAAVNSRLVFNNESTMYREVLPTFRKLQLDANVPDDENFLYAECYGCLTEPPNEVILLEDLKERGFSNLDKYQTLPNKAVMITLKNFAILHSLSYVLKNSNPEIYDQYKSKLENYFDSFSRSVYDLVAEQLEKINIQSVLEDSEEKYNNILKQTIASTGTIAKNLANVDGNSKYSVIRQGDTWTTNIMFNSERNEIKKCIMIDYQLSSEANPVCDLLYMIFICTDYNTRSKHFYDWIDYYHDQLDKALHRYGLKANFIYSKDQLHADIKRYAKQCFLLAVFVFTKIFRKSEEGDRFKLNFNDDHINKVEETMNITCFRAETVTIVKKRIEELIDSCLELELI